MEMISSHELIAGHLLMERDAKNINVYRLLCPTYSNDTWVLVLTRLGQLIANEENESEKSKVKKGLGSTTYNQNRRSLLSAKEIRESNVRCIRIDRRELIRRVDERDWLPLDMELTGAMVIPYVSLSASAKLSTDKRIEVMDEFLDPVQVMKNFALGENFGPMIRRALEKLDQKGAKNARSHVYNLLRLLINYGFTSTSLHAADHLRGAPGELRPYGPGSTRCNEAVERNRPGRKTEAVRVGEDDFETLYVSEEMQIAIAVYLKSESKPGVPFKKLYKGVLENFYAIKVEFREGKPRYILPPPGQYPNPDQVRHIKNMYIDGLSWAKARTTPNHWKKNHRAMHGTTRDGVIGPGHVYAIDSTIADVYLRSTINTDWIAGRPSVYWVMDVWSTAIVGFYVGFEFASWSAAKLALYVTFSDPAAISELYGFEFPQTLYPRPLLPAQLLGDRGEYLSHGGAGTAKKFGFNMEYNPSFRADLRGVGERIHRTNKDDDFVFLPGAFDRRRKELELKPDCSLSTLILIDYFKKLAFFAARHNECAEREDRCPAEMIADGAEMTPAGLWAWGYACGIGYRKETQVNLETNLLTEIPIDWKQNGPHFGVLRYDAPEYLWDISSEARNFGVQHYSGFQVPGALNQVFVDVGMPGLEKITMSPGGLVGSDASLYDLCDANSLKTVAKRKQRHGRTQAAINWDAKSDAVKRDAEARAQSRLHRERDFFRDGGASQVQALEASEDEQATRQQSNRVQNLITEYLTGDQSYE